MVCSNVCSGNIMDFKRSIVRKKIEAFEMWIWSRDDWRRSAGEIK